MLIKKTAPKQILAWSSAALIVVSMHVGVGYLALSLAKNNNTVMGGQEAIMLEFAEEPMAPDVDEVSETIQEETVADVPKEITQIEEKPKEVAQAEPQFLKPENITQPDTPEQELKDSDMVEEVKKPEEVPIPLKKPEEVKKVVKKPKSEQKKAAPKRPVKKAEKTQKAKGPQIVAKKGSTFAAPNNNRQFGDNGRLVASWQNKVQRRIAFMASRSSSIKSARGKSTYVTFSFDQKGNILGARTSRSSGDSTVDSLALQIIQKSSPIPSPPEGWSGPLTVPVEMR
ncbi:TonB family protein [Bartonella tamiae]|uniref:TonB family domain-containing protein n=1 Tax=Bartonella tamiae Th239 TaxID=1094558 RepID=J1JX12_9HYPH|nr:TonB family protein [Bartonella tamiae]EJF89140.1 TonB family domain-containing protein [Bartonella tamiae Th239]EJF95457.1 TonB family domain-containing protein [Bartonella tamiae Th307]